MTGKTTDNFSRVVRERAVGLALDHECDYPSRWEACKSISTKTGFSAHTLCDWVKNNKVDTGKRAGISTGVAENPRALERENRELRLANKILRKPSAYFAQAEPPPKKKMGQRAGRSPRPGGRNG